MISPRYGCAESEKCFSRFTDGLPELTISSVEYCDSITPALGGEYRPNPRETLLVVGFSLRSLGEAKVTVFYLDWFQITDADANTYPAHKLSATDDINDILPHKVDHIEMSPPAPYLGKLLLFSIPTSAGELTLEFKGDLDEFPPVYLGA